MNRWGIWALCTLVVPQTWAASQSYLGADLNFHSGPVNNSHIRQFSYGGVFQAETDGPLRYVLGLSARRGAFDLTVANNVHSVISLDLQVRMGALLDPAIFMRNTLRPVLGVYGLGGANLLTSGDPPTGASVSQAAYGWGYEFEAGLNLRLGYSGGVRLTGAYRKYQFSYGGQSIASDAFAGRLGFFF